MAGNEIVAAQPAYSRLSTSGVTTIEIVPSTSTSHKLFKRRDPQVAAHFYIYIVALESIARLNLVVIRRSVPGWAVAAADSEGRGEHNLVTAEAAFAAVRRPGQLQPQTERNIGQRSWQ